MLLSFEKAIWIKRPGFLSFSLQLATSRGETIGIDPARVVSVDGKRCKYTHLLYSEIVFTDGENAVYEDLYSSPHVVIAEINNALEVPIQPA